MWKCRHACEICLACSLWRVPRCIWLRATEGDCSQTGSPQVAWPASPKHAHKHTHTHTNIRWSHPSMLGCYSGWLNKRLRGILWEGGSLAGLYTWKYFVCFITSAVKELWGCEPQLEINHHFLTWDSFQVMDLKCMWHASPAMTDSSLQRAVSQAGLWGRGWAASQGPPLSCVYIRKKATTEWHQRHWFVAFQREECGFCPEVMDAMER